MKLKIAQKLIGERLVVNDENVPLPALPLRRGLTKDQAAAYLGIGVTLLASLDIPFVKFGRRLVYDVLDLDAWLTEYKTRGRTGKETLWPVKLDSISGQIPATGGLMLSYQTENDYEAALRPRTSVTRKRS